jgi:tetratricopeptide (TPR) repeat protein
MMLETLREFAFDQLQDSGEAQLLLDRHQQWFLEFAERAAEELRGIDQDDWLRALEMDHGNIRSAVARALGADPETAQRFAAALWFFWFHRGHLSEGRDLIEQSLAADSASSAVRAAALLGLTNLDRHQNLLDDAQSNGETALAIYRQLDDRAGIADALGQLGAIAQHQGDLARSETLLTEAVDILRELDNRERLSFTLNVLGSFKLLNGDLDEAAMLYEESRDLGQELNDQAKVAHASVNLGEVKQLQGDLDEARSLYHECLQLYHQTGMKMALAYVMEILAGLESHLGRTRAAALLFGAADAIRTQIDSPIEPFNKDRYDRDLDTTREQLGRAQFDELFREGHGSSTNAVIRTVLESDKAD